MRYFPVRALILATVLFAGVAPSHAEDRYTGKIIDGALAPATDHPAVTKVLLPDSICTGTLVGSRYVLTAAHCFFDSRNRKLGSASGISAVINNVEYAAARFTVHPTYVSRSSACVSGEMDAAILELSGDVTGVSAVPLQRSAPTVGSSLLLVGFGTQGTGRNGEDDTLPPDGFVNFGSTVIEEVPDSLYVNWNFNQGESNTASGDSGGPAFVDLGGVRYINSITCGGTGRAEFGTESTNTRADALASWVDATIGTSAPNEAPTLLGLGSLTTGANQTFLYTVQTTGTAPITITAGELPPGLSLSGSTITGTPTVAGTYTVQLQAGNSIGTTSGALIIVVTPFNPDDALVLTKAKVDFGENATDLLSLQGTITLGANFNPKGAVVRIQIAELVDTFKLNRNGFVQRRGGFDFLRLNGRLRKGVFATQTVRFSVGLGDREDLYDKLDQLFPFETSELSPDFRVNLPVEFELNGVTYHKTIPMKLQRGDRWKNG